MKTDPLISVIVPVYNVAEYLSACVQSVQGQSYAHWELLLVDDGSTDGSGPLCDGFAAGDPRIRVIHKENGGSSFARNAGIKAAKGDRLIFLDSDDYWAHPAFLETVAAHCREDNLVVWGFQRCPEHGRVLLEDPRWQTEEFSFRADYGYLFRNGILLASACFIAVPRAFFRDDRLLFVPGETSEDVEWTAALLRSAEGITVLRESVYAYRVRSGSISDRWTDRTLSCMRKHLLCLIADYAGVSPGLDAYIAEQAANYVIILSRCPHSEKELAVAGTLVPYLKNALRRRSRLIRCAISLFGLPVTLRLLRLADPGRK